MLIDLNVSLTNQHVFSSSLSLPNRTKWKRQTAVGLELLAEAGNIAAVQRMLQTSPYWIQQYGNVTSSVLAAATGNPQLPGQMPGATTTAPATGATPFDIYYRQAAAALQQKHHNGAAGGEGVSPPILPPMSAALSPNSSTSTNTTTNVSTAASMYVPPAGALSRFNPLYLSSLPPGAAASLLAASGVTAGGGGGVNNVDQNSGLLMASMGHNPLAMAMGGHLGGYGGPKDMVSNKLDLELDSPKKIGSAASSGHSTPPTSPDTHNNSTPMTRGASPSAAAAPIYVGSSGKGSP